VGFLEFREKNYRISTMAKEDIRPIDSSK